MKFKGVTLFACILFVIGCGVFIYTKYIEHPNQMSEHIEPSIATSTHVQAHTQSHHTQVASDASAPAVEQYIKKHISDFAAVQAELGRSYEVTKVEAANGKGVAYYQNDYNKYIADFNYSIDDFGSVSIDRFVTRPVEE